MADNADVVLEAMKKMDKPVRPGDVATETGLPKEDVSKAIQSLKKEGKVVSPKRCFWEPA
jgi:biotin operon repressor